jgi:cell division septum initiation protein DivIVA
MANENWQQSIERRLHKFYDDIQELRHENIALRERVVELRRRSDDLNTALAIARRADDIGTLALEKTSELERWRWEVGCLATPDR